VSFFGKLFGTDAAADNIINRGFDLVDKSFYTKQEQGEAALKAEAEARGLIVEWLQATTGSRLARRALAFMITGTWLFMYIAATLLSFAAVWVNDTLTGARLTASTTLLDGRIETMTSPVMLILGFYFAAPYMGDLARGALEKFGKGKG
jgi:hypothetical protein